MLRHNRKLKMSSSICQMHKWRQCNWFGTMNLSVQRHASSNGSTTIDSTICECWRSRTILSSYLEGESCVTFRLCLKACATDITNAEHACNTIYLFSCARDVKLGGQKINFSIFRVLLTWNFDVILRLLSFLKFEADHRSLIWYANKNNNSSKYEYAIYIVI